MPEPYIQEYQVGPLPVNNGTTKLAELNEIYNSGKGYIRVYDQDTAAILAFTYTETASVADLTQKLINCVSCSNCFMIVCELSFHIDNRADCFGCFERYLRGRW